MQQGRRYIFEECRQPMKWGKEADEGLIDLFLCLCELRKCHPVLVSGTRRLTHLDASNGIYGYLREQGTEKAWVIVNLSPSPHAVPLPEDLRDTASELLSDLSIQDRQINLPPYGSTFVC